LTPGRRVQSPASSLTQKVSQPGVTTGVMHWWIIVVDVANVSEFRDVSHFNQFEAHNVDSLVIYVDRLGVMLLITDCLHFI